VERRPAHLRRQQKCHRREHDVAGPGNLHDRDLDRQFLGDGVGRAENDSGRYIKRDSPQGDVDVPTQTLPVPHWLAGRLHDFWPIANGRRQKLTRTPPLIAC
jgi:hypothetical protein